MTRIKICGLTNLADAEFAIEAGADFLGFIMAPMSKRYIEPATVATILEPLRQEYGEAMPTCVGVFVTKATTAHEMEIHCKMAGVDVAQVVGIDSQGWLEGQVPAFAAIRPETAQQARIEATQWENLNLSATMPTLLVDAFHPTLYGGTGETTPDEVAIALQENVTRLMLAGGLTPENVADYVRKIQPWAVDVASGTEAFPGKKDYAKIKEFVQSVQTVKLEDKVNDNR